MPIYEYHCECNKEREVKLSFNDADQPQVCDCGKVMQRKVSLSSFTMKSTGNQMALDSINSKGGGFPDANKNKSWVQQKAFEGTQRQPKTVW